MQLKCTHTDTGDGDHLTYPLKLKNYDDLRAETIVPRILVVVSVPEDIDSWLHCTEAEMCQALCILGVSPWHANDHKHDIGYRIPPENGPIYSRRVTVNHETR